jgi:hypothetical protein
MAKLHSFEVTGPRCWGRRKRTPRRSILILKTEEDIHEQPGAPKRGRRRLLIYLILLALIGFGAWRLLATKGQNELRTQSEAQPVGAAEVVVGDIAETRAGLGTVSPLVTIFYAKNSCPS